MHELLELAALVVGGLLADSVNELLTIVMLVDGLLLAALLAVSLHLIRHPAADVVAAPAGARDVDA